MHGEYEVSWVVYLYKASVAFRLVYFLVLYS